VANVAVPPLRIPVPIVLLPFLKVTVPVAVFGAIVAVKVTDWVSPDGFRDEAKVTVVEPLLTVWVKTDDVLVL
jgi:hypothetical protein